MAVKIKLVCVLFICAFFLSGCKTTLLVHNTTVKQITPIFKDFAGTHGYLLTYQNEQTGSYRLDMGSVFLPYTSQTIKSQSTVQYQSASNQPMSAYEQTTWNTVANPAHYVQASAAVTIIQQGSDVLIILDGNDAASTSLSDARDFIQSFGYTVDSK